MIQICPTVTAFDKSDYQSQIVAVISFANRIHIDLMDGVFAPSLSPELEDIWLPDKIVSDIHLMYQKPQAYLDQIIKLKPNMVIVHIEVELDHHEFVRRLKQNGIKSGLAVLQQTVLSAESIELMADYDQVLIFSGRLGYHGGQADLGLLTKVRQVKEIYPGLEIAWDGGINDQNVKTITGAGVSVLNVGGFIQKSESPVEAYAKIKASL
jgi:ribulose-phosphate 3-epimerase